MMRNLEVPARAEFRPLKPDDAPAAARLAQLCFLGEEAWSEAGFRAETQNTRARSLCAWQDGELVGFVCGVEVCGEATVNLIAVAPALRGRGLGGRMLGAFLDGLPEGTRVSLEVRESNAPALALYRRFGFAPVGRRRDFYRDPSEDALVLRN